MQRDATTHAGPAPRSKAAASAAVHVAARGAMHSCHGMQVSVEHCHTQHFQWQRPHRPEPCRARLVAGGSLVAAVACVCGALAGGAAAIDLQPGNRTGAGHSFVLFSLAVAAAHPPQMAPVTSPAAGNFQAAHLEAKCSSPARNRSNKGTLASSKPSHIVSTAAAQAGRCLPSDCVAMTSILQCLSHAAHGMPTLSGAAATHDVPSPCDRAPAGSPKLGPGHPTGGPALRQQGHLLMAWCQ